MLKKSVTSVSLPTGMRSMGADSVLSCQIVFYRCPLTQFITYHTFRLNHNKNKLAQSSPCPHVKKICHLSIKIRLPGQVVTSL